MLVRWLLVVCLVLLAPMTVHAYSYGDPNKEELAETYKEIAAKLEKQPPDWDGAYQAYLARKNEISLEFGQQTVQILEDSFTARDKQLVLNNYKAVLILNINRRLNYAEKQFDDYAQAKLLLAKGRGTLNVLSPYINAGTSKQAYDAFDKALAALGNPGLFGVGKVEPDKEEFLKQSKQIRSLLDPLYKLKAPAQAKPDAAEKPAVPHEAALPAQQPKKEQPSDQAKAVSQSAAAKNTAVSDRVETVSSGTDQQAGAEPFAERNGETANTDDAGLSETAAGDPSAASETAETAAAESASGSAQSPTDSAVTESAVGTSEDAGIKSESASVPAAPSAPVPDSKVNPLVTVSVIGGLLLTAGIIFWWSKRKGLL
ncbi:MAG: hypothetical protein H0Z34_07250 [Brevibacillus sp.]|nr:hypothetical protein [Brevibacillus sp.]